MIRTGAFVVAALLACGVAGGAGARRDDGTLELQRSDSQLLQRQSAVAAATAWCGSAASADRAPNAVAGNPVHWVYFISSDGPDNLGAVGTAMQSDAEQVDAWWHGQDPSRTPRNDVATFSCGTQLDITTVRSSLSSSQLAPLAGRFSSIFESVEQAGLSSVFTKYVVYYDGPSDEDNICGQGGSDSSGFGLAVVYYRACGGVSIAAVAAHELLHTMGAVPNGAPHQCTGETSGHTCDSDADLMYPYIGGDPLSAKLLDPGRDDYYGHSGAWTDSQDSAWLVRLDGQTAFAVTVAGPGTVSADVPGLHCATSCTTTWNTGQQLVLTATPRDGAKLVRWGGGCSGGEDCTLAVNAGASVSALFAPSVFRLTVTVKGRGAVRISSGAACRTKCSPTLSSFEPARLTAVPAKGWKLRVWSGACTGARKTCTVPMRAATSVRATFVRR